MARKVRSSRTVQEEFCATRCRSFIFLLLVGSFGSTDAARPEVILRDVLTKPVIWLDNLKNASEECRTDVAAYVEDLENYVPWALQMYDASAKLSPGVITGNYKQLGNYDQCIRAQSGHGFVGQACSATIQFNVTGDESRHALDIGDLFLQVARASNATTWTSGQTVPYEWMWCVPSTCTYSEIQRALQLALDSLVVAGRVGLTVELKESSCRTVKNERVTFDTADCVYISILIAFAAIIAASTTYDVANRNRLNPINRQEMKHVLLSSFSLYTNCKNLLRTDRRGDSIGCLDGLRYLSICWIIYGHTYYNEVVGVKIDLTQVPRMHHNWSTLLVLNGNIVTDTFFLLSGILIAYTEMSKRQKIANWRFDVVGLYLHRYIRLTPAYAMMIGFYATLLFKTGTGPQWDNWVGVNRDFCRDNWWINLLYVNNYVDVSNMCMSQSWYLSTDMQLVWLSPIILYPMLKFGRSAFFWVALSTGFLLSILAPFLITYYLSLTGTMLYYKDTTDVANVYCYIYTRVYTRAGPYIIGMGLGYLLHRTRSYRMKIPMHYVTCGWLIAAVAGLSAVFGPVGMYYDNHVYNKIEASFYAGLHRHVFAASVSWIIFATIHGYGGIIGKFLSWRGWIPLSKLTYSAYLCHYIFLLTYSGSVRTSGILSPIGVVYVFWGNLALTMILAIVWTLSFEMPFMTLDRVLVSRGKLPSNLTIKTDPSKTIYGSTVSAKEIYRPTDETSSTISRTTYDTDYARKSNQDVYNSASSINYDEREVVPSKDSPLEQTESNYIYVINGLDSRNSWPGSTRSVDKYQSYQNRPNTCYGNGKMVEELSGRTRVEGVDCEGYPYRPVYGPSEERSPSMLRSNWQEDCKPEMAKKIVS